MRRRRWPAGLAALVVAAVGAGACESVQAAIRNGVGLRAQVGAVIALPPRARSLGPVSPGRRLGLTVALTPSDPGALSVQAMGVATPGSPSFRRYLSVSQFAARYGAPADARAAVTRALTAAGLSVGAPAANGLSLPVTGSVAAIRRALRVDLRQVRLPGGRVAISNLTPPSLPVAVAGDVEDVIGLSDVALARAQPVLRPAVGSSAPRLPAAAPTSPGPTPLCSGPSASGGYTADRIAAAYDFNPLYAAGDEGAGQTVGIFELAPYSPADIAAYQTCYGTSAGVVDVPVDGGLAYTGGPDIEPALDIEQVIGLAPQASLRVYTAPDTGTGPYDVYTAMASQDVAKVVTSSWGLCEPQLAAGHYQYARAEGTVFAEMALQGQGLLVSSGDAGSAACAATNPAATQLAVGDPANAPFATGVGGSSLYTVSSGLLTLWAPGAPLDEGVFNEGVVKGVPDASTGGVSAAWGMPAYQSAAAPALGVVGSYSSATTCAAAAPGAVDCRQEPDVSADADPFFGYATYITDSSGSSWQPIGGTSASAPVWAALMALANAQVSCRGLTIGFANPALYRLAGSD